MAEEKKKQKFSEKLKNKFRITVYNDLTLQEVLGFRASKLNAIIIGFSALALIMFVVFMLLIYSPLNVFLPSHTNSEMRQQILANASRLDTLVYQVRIRDQYINNLRNIIDGKEVENYTISEDSVRIYNNLTFEKSPEDSMMRLQIEQDEKTGSGLKREGAIANSFNSMSFFAPLNKGIVTNKFNASEEHYGIDIVAAPNAGIMATLDGTVISATWTIETGNVIHLQHENDLISAYKHNSTLLKKAGESVKAGEIIAVIGNSGELTTGPHLHFELWHKGIPLNPEDYIVF